VFPYGEGASPCTIPFAFKALLASPALPPRYNTAPTQPASIPYTLQPIPKQARDEAGAKYLMRRVLSLFREPVAVL
jgi:hypothetical protein